MTNLDNARKLNELIKNHSRSGNLSLYHESQEQGISFSELLEQIDNSDPGSSNDAFERQLMVFDLTSDGPRSVTLEQFITGGGLILLPEYMRREILYGYKMVQDPTELVATIVHDEGPSIRPLYIRTSSARESLAMRGVGGGGAYPRVEMLYREKEAQIVDRGRQFDFAYRVIKNQKLTEFRVFLRWIGAQMAYDEIDEIYNILLNGDDTSDGATDVFNGVGGTLAYSDVVHLALSFDGPARLTHIMAAKSDVEKILNLSQFQDAEAFLTNENYQRTGDYRSLQPLNARLVNVPNATATKIIGLDSRFAIRESVAQPLMIEAEKVINQKLETAVVSKESVYTILVDGTALLSDY